MFSIYPAISGYAIMRYQLFDVKMVVTQILTFILWIFILIRTLLSESFREEMVNLALLVITIILGIFLIKSVKKEIKQREHIEKLAEDLEKANENQVALIHFITHQVKGFFTKSRDIFSLLIENEAGELPEPAKKYLHEGFDSDTKGVAMVEDVLSAANIKSGAVTYDLKPIDLGELISGMIKEYKKTAENKGLSFTYNTKNISGGYIINADKEKLVNVFRNLIENSIKYTPKGAMVISLFKKSILDQKGMPIDKVVFSVEDTGVGITPEDKKMLFTQGGRGKDSVKINVDSTGYGLFIAKGIVEAHGGRIWVDSDGPGKGSKFYVEIDAIGK
jgi:signal transduction histidine kinase